MSQWVASKPEGLRSDQNINNGVYVGTYKNNVSLECSLAPTSDDIVLGECSQPVNQAYIDDEKGEVYIPVGDKFLKLDEEDGIKKTLTFKDRLAQWLHSTSKTLYGYELKYIFRGAKSLKNDEFFLVQDKFGGEDDIHLDLAGYVLKTLKKEGQTQFDWKRDNDLIFESAARWINNFGEDETPLYYHEGFAVLQKLAMNMDLPSDFRLRAANVVLADGSPEQKEAMGHLLDGFVADKELNPTLRLDTAKVLHGERQTMESWQTVLAFAVDGEFPSSLRYDAAVFAYIRFVKSESQQMSMYAMLGLGNDSTADGDVRMKAIKFVRTYEREEYEKILDAYINIAKDKAGITPQLRLDAATSALNYAQYFFHKKREIGEILLDLAKDPLI